MKKKYNIGDMEFKTKKECENFTRSFIHKLGCCIINKDHKDFIFFVNLIRNHPEYEIKKGTGIDSFSIVPNPMMNKYYQTMIKRLDGTEIDFSWVYCCQFKERTPTFNLIRSMRSAISDDIIKYKRTHSLTCNYCKTNTEVYENYHVDHDSPSFQTLKDNFLQLTTKQIPTSFTDCKKNHYAIFKEADVDFKKDWVDYHNNHCNLQILCRDCNLRKR